jgi:ADP-heptose:LPS heptosyltransferase
MVEDHQAPPAVAQGEAGQPLLQRVPQPVRKVVLVRASRIGDFLCAVPALRALRAALPAAEVTLIGLPFVQPLAERSPYLDRFVPFPGFPGMADQFFDARQALAFCAAMQAEDFDLAVQMHGSGVYSNVFTLMLGARVAAGFVRPGDPPGRLAAALPFPAAGYESERLLALATFLGAPDRGLAGEFPLWDKDRTAARALLAGAVPPLIGLHPTARDATKRWPLENFAAAGAALLRDTGGTVLLLGGPDELPQAEAVRRLMTAAGAALDRVVNLAGRTSLGALGAVIEQAAVLITNDSGPAHIAYALNTPTATIFGGTNPARWGPPASPLFRVIVNPVPCWPCDYLECPVGYGCLKGIEVDRVVAAARDVMRDAKRIPG